MLARSELFTCTPLRGVAELPCRGRLRTGVSVSVSGSAVPGPLFDPSDAPLSAPVPVVENLTVHVAPGRVPTAFLHVRRNAVRPAIRTGMRDARKLRTGVHHAPVLRTVGRPEQRDGGHPQGQVAPDAQQHREPVRRTVTTDGPADITEGNRATATTQSPPAG